MYAEKNHLCTGNSCIFCRIFTGSQLGQLGQAGSQTLIPEQSLSIIQALPQLDGLASKGETIASIDRLEMIEKEFIMRTLLCKNCRRK
jgi:hypothetical protein